MKKSIWTTSIISFSLIAGPTAFADRQGSTAAGPGSTGGVFIGIQKTGNGSTGGSTKVTVDVNKSSDRLKAVARPDSSDGGSLRGSTKAQVITLSNGTTQAIKPARIDGTDKPIDPNSIPSSNAQSTDTKKLTPKEVAAMCELNSKDKKVSDDDKFVRLSDFQHNENTEDAFYAKKIRQQMVYASDDPKVNYFADEKLKTKNLVGYNKGALKDGCMIRQNVARALVKAQKALSQTKGHENSCLLVYDCYRPKESTIEMRKIVALRNSNETGDGVARGVSQANHGVAVDLTIAECGPRGKAKRMGSEFDGFGGAKNKVYFHSTPDAAMFTEEEVKNQELLRKVMNEAGFCGFRKEWWDYTLPAGKTDKDCNTLEGRREMVKANNKKFEKMSAPKTVTSAAFCAGQETIDGQVITAQDRQQAATEVVRSGKSDRL